MPDPTRSHELERWIESRPLTRKIVCVRMRGQWVAEIRDDAIAGSFVGSGRSLHDAIEAAQDEQDSAARRAVPPPPVRRAAVLSSLVADTEPVLSSERDSRGLYDELLAAVGEAPGELLTEGEHQELRAELLEATLPSDVPEFCPCGHDWPWAKGQSIGVQHAEGEAYEMRNCPHCGSTRMRVLPFSAREQAAYLHGPGSDEENRAAARESLGFRE